MSCEKWIKYINFVEDAGRWGITWCLTGESVKINYCPFCGSKLDKNGCTKVEISRHSSRW